MAFNWFTKSTRVSFFLKQRYFISFFSRIHIALTQIHAQPGVIDKLLEDTRQCVKEILSSSDKKDTITVSYIAKTRSILSIILLGCDLWYESKNTR